MAENYEMQEVRSEKEIKMKEEKEGGKWMYSQISIACISYLWKLSSYQPIFMIQQSRSLWFAILGVSAENGNLGQSETLL